MNPDIQAMIEIIKAVASSGVLGGVVAWFMWRDGKVTKELRILSKVILMDMLSRDNLPIKTRTEAKNLFAQIHTGDTIQPGD